MNHLQYETSPYLLQHAANPVDWFPWSDEAFEKAQEANKPVLVSIGYAACHWCHVMEHESFEDETVAAYMNEHFICIKVDREEHPDVDHFYMDALQAMSGQGGWPLNMFVTPGRKPFYGGTYFPPVAMYQRASWMEVLQAIHNSWIERKEDVDLQSEQLIKHLQNASMAISDQAGTFDKETMDEIAVKLHRQADRFDGGFGQSPKFPSTMAIQYLLEHYHFTQNENSLQVALLSLDKMIAGGIYDQVGGGFARYATDNKWLVPHFEKMLYDNALLTAVLCDAYQITKDEKYKAVIEDTIAFCLREMKSDEGLFYSALDADSEGVEGKYYTWTRDEWKAALPDAHPAVEAYFGISEKGNWEHTNILHQARRESEIIRQYGLTESEWHNVLSESKQALFNARGQRIRPVTDDKIILSWNALMNIALTRAAKDFDSEGYLQIAQQQMDVLLQKFKDTDRRLLHTYKNGSAKISAKLDDYAFLIAALLQLASASADASYILQAKELLESAVNDFSDADKRFFYFSSRYQTDIPVRKVETYDGALPSANAVMMQNLWLMGNLTEHPEWLQRSMAMLRSVINTASAYPLSFSRWNSFAQRYVHGYKQLIIVGTHAADMLREWNACYYPGVFCMASDSDKNKLPIFNGKYADGTTRLFLCEDFSCRVPVRHIAEIIKDIKK